MDINALLQLLQQRFGRGQSQTAFAGGSPSFRENMGNAQLNPGMAPVNPVASGSDSTGAAPGMMGGLAPKPMQLGGGPAASTIGTGSDPMQAIMRILQSGSGAMGGPRTMRMQQF